MAKRERGLRGKSWGLIGGLIAAGASVIPLVPILRRKAMRPTTILKKDHRLASGLLMMLENTPRIGSTARKSLFGQIQHNLSVHMEAEEEIIYPALQNLLAGPDEAKVTKAYRDHQAIKDLLKDMSAMDPSSEVFDGKLAQLKSTKQSHVQEEENELFVLMKQRMPKAQFEELGKRLHNRKKELQTKVAA